MFIIYLLISEKKDRTYIGYSHNVEERIRQHRSNKVKTTKKFGQFRAYKVQVADSLSEALKREKYWKSCTGRKKLKKLFLKISFK